MGASLLWAYASGCDTLPVLFALYVFAGGPVLLCVCDRRRRTSSAQIVDENQSRLPPNDQAQKFAPSLTQNKPPMNAAATDGARVIGSGPWRVDAVSVSNGVRITYDLHDDGHMHGI